jgi:hypothetical protein
MPLDKKKDMGSHYSEHDIAEKFDRFLKSHRFTPKHKEEGKHFTHTEMNTCKGSYYINDEDYTEFVRLYKEFIHSGWEIGMVERHDDKKVGPLVCDFDFRSRKEYRSYTQEHIKNIITIFVDVMKDIFYIGDENQLQAFVYEKDSPSMDKKNNDTQYKDGFHIFWPYAPMLVEYRYLLYEIVLDRLKREKTIDDIPSIEPLTEVFDSRVIYSNGMMMYGSTKPGRSPYELTHVYNDDLTEIDIHEFDFDTKIEIICPIHKTFSQTPHHHLSGAGCQKCGNVYKKTTEEFIIKAKIKHGDLYDYSITVYINTRKKLPKYRYKNI